MMIAKGNAIPAQAAGTEEKTVEPSFSLFNAPATNVTPARNISVGEAWQVITMDMDTLSATHELRGHDPEKEGEERKRLKRTKFKFCTFSGTFSRRCRAGLLSHSQLLSIDLDHVGQEQVEELKRKLAGDKNFETALCFRSPSGDGVKWVVVIDTRRATHEEWFDATCLYIKDVYGLEADKACRDITRSCFLPHDAEAIIGKQFKENIKF